MIKIDVSGIIDLGKNFTKLAESSLEKNLSQGAQIAGAEVQAEARALVPVDTGALRISIENDSMASSNGYLVQVGPTQPYGKEIEQGRPSGTYVSPQALMGWAKRKGLNPYAVSKAIQKKGSPAQPFLFPAFDKKQDSIVAIITQAVSNAFKEAFGKTS